MRFTASGNQGAGSKADCIHRMFGLGVEEPGNGRQAHDECHMLSCMARNAVRSGRGISSSEKWSDDRVTLTSEDVALPDVQQANPGTGWSAATKQLAEDGSMP